MLVFVEGGNHENPAGEKPSEQGREPTTNSTNVRESYPGQQMMGGARSHHCAISASQMNRFCFQHPKSPSLEAVCSSWPASSLLVLEVVLEKRIDFPIFKELLAAGDCKSMACSYNKSGSAMRTYVDFHLLLITNE